MNAIRRTAVLLGLLTTVVVGSSIPASATFSASTTAVPATVGTVTVAPPTGVTLEDTWCEPGSYRTYNATTATYTTTYTLTLHARLDWQPSGTRGVTAYRIGATVNGQAMGMGDVPGTSVAVDYLVYRGAAPAPAGILTLKASVTTLTSYGWTSKTVESGWFSC